MNVGTYVRATAIDTLVEKWLECAGPEGEKRQIVSLGAGSDTRFWRLMVGKSQILCTFMAIYLMVDLG
jgi:[phosphatase 2A protein]-leucine-carboxy methyltransferase